MRNLIVLTVLGSLAAAPTSPDAHRFERKLPAVRMEEHALSRLTFGARPGDLQAIHKLGVKKWVDLQLDPQRIPENPALEAKLKPLETLWMTPADAVLRYPRRPAAKADGGGETDIAPSTPLTPEQLRTLRRGAPDDKRRLIASLPPDTLGRLIEALPRGGRQQLLTLVSESDRRKILLLNAPRSIPNYDLAQGKILRAVYSERQLAEVLADFWFNHFNVYLDKGADRYLVAAYERDAIRPGVLGRFRDLLGAAARNPAMLFYLDNWQSVAPSQARGNRRRGLNENYARELLELHTLGVDGGYTQKDIVEVARCFTGWTIRTPRLGGGFEFNERIHDKGEKVVLGVTIPAGGGMEDGERVLDILARHPATARFISRKLAIRFVADDPPQKLVDRMAKTFTATGGDLRAVMRTMLQSKEFWSEGAWRAKLKTPFEMAVSAVRASGAQVDYAFPLANQIAQLGQPLYRKMEPTGYSAASVDWLNSASLVGRMNLAAALAHNRIPGVSAADVDLYASASRETRASVDRAAEGNRPDRATLNGLVLGSPEFQRR